jgi:hypothetical protein
MQQISSCQVPVHATEMAYKSALGVCINILLFFSLNEKQNSSFALRFFIAKGTIKGVVSSAGAVAAQYAARNNSN